MMELDEFKISLQTRKPMQVPHRSQQELEQVLHKKSRSVIKKIQHSLLLEMLFALMFIIFITGMIINIPGLYTRVFSGVLLVYSIGFFCYMAGMYRHIQLRYYSLTPMYVKVRQVIRIIEKFVRLYYQVTMVFIPATLLLGFASGSLDNQVTGGMDWKSLSNHLILYYVGASVCWCILMYFFTSRYVHKLYGSHLQFLQSQLKAFEENL